MTRLTLELTPVRKDYISFFKRYPRQANPTDINTKEKFEYAMTVGYERFRMMQQARKSGYSWTRRAPHEDS